MKILVSLHLTIDLRGEEYLREFVLLDELIVKLTFENEFNRYMTQIFAMLLRICIS